MKRIKSIWPFGPAVGEFRLHSTVAESIRKQRRRSPEEQRERAQLMMEAAWKAAERRPA